MLKYIRLKNYRSFTNLFFNMTGKNNSPNKLIVIYGENGVGKTNLINVLDTITDTFNTLRIRNYVMNFIENQKEVPDSKKLSILEPIIDISHIINKNKMIDSGDEMCIEIGFCIDNKNGVYRMEFNDGSIIGERLDYVLNKNKTVFFDIKKGNKRINSQMVSASYLNELENMIDKFWGKHSLMAIFFNALDEYSEDYIKKAFSEQLRELIYYFKSYAVYLVKNKSRKDNLMHNSSILSNFEEGDIEEQKTNTLCHTEMLVNEYFKEIYTDINRAFYRTENKDNRLKYYLCFEKMISGRRLVVKYDEESCGTRNLLSLLPYFLAAMEKQVVAIDEIDNGIHDMLLSHLINDLIDNIDGQLIVTTHNSEFIDNYNLKDSIYFLINDDEGNKEIRAISDFGYRIQPNSNVMANYMKGRFAKTPWNGTNIDFKRIRRIENEI